MAAESDLAVVLASSAVRWWRSQAQELAADSHVTTGHRLVDGNLVGVAPKSPASDVSGDQPVDH
jgi:hypothetical protein